MDVEGPATFDEDATAVLAGVGITLGADIAELEDADELVVTVVNGVISPDECARGPGARKCGRVSEGVCTGLWLLDVCVGEW